MNRTFELGIEYAKKLDLQDPLRNFRERFYIREGNIYVDGNSLGLCSKDAEREILLALDDWKGNGIDIWSIKDSKYFYYPARIGAMMATLIGAQANEVTTANSTTVNIHQCAATFYKPTGERYKILMDDLNFPTDRHAVESLVRIKGYDPVDAVKIVASRDGRTLSEDDVISAMSGDVALILLPAVLYRSSQLLDMQRITDEARKRSIIIGWDLCHSIGSVAHDFAKLDADFAVWCTYKYLSGGPGSIAGLYINRKHFDKAPGLAGWFGNVKETQFRLDHRHEHSKDADGWLIGTPPILSMAGVKGALDIYCEAGMKEIREKSLHITAYLMYLIDQRLAEHGYNVGNPRDDNRRGGHVSLEHQEAYKICQALKVRNVTPDFREPDVIRLVPVALYVSYEEMYKLVDILEQIAIKKEHEAFSNVRALVV
ncbi:MAG: kynureninase [Synergistaceae bacterium]|nr:kynureninase [Synergistaceae bacterium]